MTEKFYLIDRNETEYPSYAQLLDAVLKKMQKAPKRAGVYDFNIKIRTIINENTAEEKTCAFVFDGGVRGII